MSELSQSDQLCLFQYLPGVDETPQSAGNQLPPNSLGKDQDSIPPQSLRDEAMEEPLISIDTPTNPSQAPDDPSIPQISFNQGHLNEKPHYGSMPPLPLSSPLRQEIEQAETTIAPLASPVSQSVQILYSQVMPVSPQSLSEEQERIFHLEQALDQALHYLDELNARVKHQAMLEEQVTLTEEYAYVQYQAIAHLQEDLAEHKAIIGQRNLTIATLESDRALAQTNLLSLQQDQLNLRQENAQWKNACQELQQECNRQHRKMLALEQENTVMQEQILQQARQSNEHETAVQYWKDRYTSIQQILQECQTVLEEKMSGMNNKNEESALANLLVRIQLLGEEDDKSTDTKNLPAPNLHSFSIPDFLIRRYRQRGPSSSKPWTNNPPSQSVDS